jgi:L-aminopeptidase/D-esterase-like protein
MPPAITDVPGVLVGHAHDAAALTGCTVVLTVDGATGAVDVRGGAPGTRETDLLVPEALVAQVHAVVLCGGSAFGLAAADGVMHWLAQRGHGFATSVRPVPIVPAAVIFDLAIGSGDRWPDHAMGQAACVAATALTGEGCVGAGIGATVGKLRGNAWSMKAGVGSWSERLADGTTIGALAVCNALGEVRRAQDGAVLAGVRDAVGSIVPAHRLLRQPTAQHRDATAENTTIAVVATDATLTKAEARKVAQMAHDGLARTIYPIHTPYDGDAIFVVATGRRPAPPLTLLGAIAADVLACAVERCVSEAWTLGGVPAAGDRPAPSQPSRDAHDATP